MKTARRVGRRRRRPPRLHQTPPRGAGRAARARSSASVGERETADGCRAPAVARDELGRDAGAARPAPVHRRQNGARPCARPGTAAAARKEPGRHTSRGEPTASGARRSTQCRMHGSAGARSRESAARVEQRRPHPPPLERARRAASARPQRGRAGRAAATKARRSSSSPRTRALGGARGRGRRARAVQRTGSRAEPAAGDTRRLRAWRDGREPLTRSSTRQCPPAQGARTPEEPMWKHARRPPSGRAVGTPRARAAALTLRRAAPPTARTRPDT